MNELEKLLSQEQEEARQVLIAEGKLDEAFARHKRELDDLYLKLYGYRYRLADIKREIKSFREGA